MKLISIVLLALLFAGCTAVSVRPVSATAQMKHVVIRENPKVIVRGFLDVVRDGLSRHGITSEVVPADSKIEPGQFVLTYTALRSWDVAPYLSVAEVRIERDNNPVASAHYHLRGKGGYSLLKWQSVKTKMDPVMDQLLAGVSS